MTVQPSAVPPGWVGQRHDARRSRRLVDPPPLPHRGSDAVTGEAAVETKALSVLPDQEHQLDVGQLRQDARMPSLRAFATRRQVAALGVVSRKTEAHAEDRHVSSVVERFLVEAEPIAKANARRIGIGSAGRMSACARRLADDADARGRLRLEDGTRLVRQAVTIARGVATYSTGANASHQTVEFVLHRNSPRHRTEAVAAPWEGRQPSRLESRYARSATALLWASSYAP